MKKKLINSVVKLLVAAIIAGLFFAFGVFFSFAFYMRSLIGMNIWLWTVVPLGMIIGFTLGIKLFECRLQKENRRAIFVWPLSGVIIGGVIGTILRSGMIDAAFPHMFAFAVISIIIREIVINKKN